MGPYDEQRRARPILPAQHRVRAERASPEVGVVEREGLCWSGGAVGIDPGTFALTCAAAHRGVVQRDDRAIVPAVLIEAERAG